MLAGLGAAAAMPVAQGAAFAQAPATDWSALAAAVKAEMRWAWQRYRAVAWGADEVRPVSGSGRSFLIPDATVGLSIVEALDTLWLMGLDAELEDAVRWIRQRLTFNLDGDAQLFEASIRLVGGVLSGHLATGEARLLELAHDLATRMMPAFDTPTGMPMRFVNLRTGKTRDPLSFPAEIGGGMAPEYVTLSRLTGDPRFGKVAVDAMLALHARRSAIGLVGDTIDVRSGQWVTRTATVGPPTDSYYEYLWDTWRLTGDTRCRDAYRSATDAVIRWQGDRSSGRLWFYDVDFETGGRLNANQSELSAFYPGLLAEGGDQEIAVEHMASWTDAQGRYGILPHVFNAQTGEIVAPANALRPELADAAFTLWLGSRDERWRHVARTHFLNMRQWMKAQHGYSGLADIRVHATGRGGLGPFAFDDACPGYWWSEQMKYYWLIFSDCPRFDYADNYLSTEGNVLRGLKRV